MTVATEPAARDARPPDVGVRVTNLIVRPLLRTPVARLFTPLALLEFKGRRSGGQRRIVVGWHVIGDVGFVVTPARWRANFIGGHPTTVHRRGTSMALVGRLVNDPAAVAERDQPTARQRDLGSLARPAHSPRPHDRQGRRRRDRSGSDPIRPRERPPGLTATQPKFSRRVTRR